MIRDLGNWAVGVLLATWLAVSWISGNLRNFRKSSKNAILRILLILAVPAICTAQGTLMQLPPLTNSLGQPIAGATISVFTTTGNLPNLVCTTPVTVYKDVALSPAQAFTTLTTDGNGNYPFFIAASANPYGLTVSGAGTNTSTCYGFTAPLPPSGGSPSFLNLTVTGTLGVTGATSLGLVTSMGNVQWVTGASDFASKMTLACNGTVPGTVWMPIGSTVTVNPKAIPSNCTVKCPSPWACKLTLANASNANFFTQASAVAANIVIEDMIIDGNQANQSGTSSCMYFQTVNGLQVRHNIIQNCRNHGVFVDGCQTYVGAACTVPVPSQNIWVEENIISAPILGHGVELGNGPAPADTVVQSFHVRGNTILHTSAALVNGIFTLGATSVGVCGTGPGDITNNIVNGATDTGIEVGQGSCQVTVTGNNVSLGAVTGTSGIGIRSAQEVTVANNQVHGTSTNTTQVCYLIWNNAGNDDLKFSNVNFSGNTAKGCNGNAISTATYTSGGSITGTGGQTCGVTFGTGGGTGTVALTGVNVIAGGTSITITGTGGAYTAAPTSATLSNGTATCSGTAVVASVLSLTSFDVQVNLGNAGTAGVGDRLKMAGFITDGGPQSYNYLSLPTNFDRSHNDDENITTSAAKPARATQDSAGAGFYPYASPIFQGSSPLNVEMRATNTALPNGLYRYTVSGSQWLLQRNTAAAGDFTSASTEIGDDGSGNISIQQGQLIAQGIGGFRNTSDTVNDEGTPGGAAAGKDVLQGDSTAHCLKASYNNGSFFCLPQVIGSGTATMTTAGITGPNCGTTVTVAATGVATTDTITFADNAAPAATTNGPLVIKAWPTANNVNFAYCVQSGTITPAAATLNWRVMR